jgi:hypothetical protein
MNAFPIYGKPPGTIVSPLTPKPTGCDSYPTGSSRLSLCERFYEAEVPPISNNSSLRVPFSDSLSDEFHSRRTIPVKLARFIFFMSLDCE